MRKDDLIRRSINIITEYYQNRLEPFFESIAQDVLWLGPAQGQQIRGREDVIRAWSAEKHALTFTMGTITAMCVLPQAHVMEVLLQYEIFTHYPSGRTDRHEQRLHYTWRERRVGGEYRAEIVMLHISNLWPYSSRDRIYPVHYEELSAPRDMPQETSSRVTLKGEDGAVHRLSPDRIIYAETVKRSAKVRVHTDTGVITINGTLADLEKRCPSIFLRIHSGYLVNPAHARQVRRFAVTLSDGTQLPIPEKKYTHVKSQLLGEDGEERIP